jgi:hypothetical protein
LAGNYRCYQESKKRDPILQVGNCEPEQWWQKKVVVSHRGNDRCENCATQAPGSGDQQNDEQEAESAFFGEVFDQTNRNLVLDPLAIRFSRVGRLTDSEPASGLQFSR